MHHLDAEQARAWFADRAHPVAGRELALLRRIEVDEAQLAGAAVVLEVGDQHASGPARDLAAHHRAFDLDRARRTGPRERADRHDAGVILVAQRQVEREIELAPDAQLGEALDSAGVGYGTTITASTSNAAPLGRAATPRVARAG